VTGRLQAYGANVLAVGSADAALQILRSMLIRRIA
jgi:hypothetical protein